MVTCSGGRGKASSEKDVEGCVDGQVNKGKHVLGMCCARDMEFE